MTTWPSSSNRQDTHAAGAPRQRGFVYALEPLHRRRGWQFDQAWMVLARARSELEDQRRHLEELSDACEEYSEFVQQAWTRRVEPLGHAQSLAYLCGLQAEIEAQSVTIAALRSNVERLEQAYFEAQRNLEIIQRHRDQALQEHELELLRQESAEADRGWLARQGRFKPAIGTDLSDGGL